MSHLDTLRKILAAPPDHPDLDRIGWTRRKGRTMNGTIRNMHADKGFGFIRGEDGKDYFMHRSAVKNAKFEELEVGREVTFEETEGSKGLRAEDVYV